MDAAAAVLPFRQAFTIATAKGKILEKGRYEQRCKKQRPRDDRHSEDLHQLSDTAFPVDSGGFLQAYMFKTKTGA